MDIIKLYQDYGVINYTEGHKHCREGWVNTVCPFCKGNAGVHLGFNISEGYFVCWRCGGHPITKTIAGILNISEKEAYGLAQHYGALAYARPRIKKKPKGKKDFRIPTGVTKLTKKHKSYLEGRNFDPDKLEKLWNLQSTGPMSRLDGAHYKHRILIPFIWNEEIVSFDSRDVTGKAKDKYKACPIAFETIEHKNILYGKQECWREMGIGVEGCTDVWRFGPRSCSTSGIKYTLKQLRVIAKTFKRFAVVYDDDPQAIIEANKLVADLRFRGVDAFRIDIEGDPGDMSQDDADHLVRELTKKIK